MEFFWNVETPIESGIPEIPPIFVPTNRRGNPSKIQPPILAVPKIGPISLKKRKRLHPNRGNLVLLRAVPLPSQNRGLSNSPTHNLPPHRVPTCVPTHIPGSIPSSTCISLSILTCSPTCVPTHIQIFTPTCIPTHIPTHLLAPIRIPTCVPTHTQICTPTCIRTYIPTHRPARRVDRIPSWEAPRRARRATAIPSTATSSDSAGNAPRRPRSVRFREFHKSRLLRSAGSGSTSHGEGDPTGVQATGAAISSG